MAYMIDTPGHRCREVRNDFQCVLGNPHDGEHVSVGGKVRWPQAGETVTRVEVSNPLHGSIAAADHRDGTLRSTDYSMADLLARHDAAETMIEALVERVAALESAATAAAPASDAWDADSEEPPRGGRYVDTAGFEWTFQNDVWSYWNDDQRNAHYTWTGLTHAAADNPALPAFPWKRVTSWGARPS
jgi:hypothetical protein